MKQFKTNKIIFTVMLLGLYVISLYLLGQYSTLNVMDTVMISLIVIIGLLAIHLSMMIGLITTFLITLGYGIFVIITGSIERFEPVTINYYYLVVPTIVVVLAGMIGLLNEKHLRISDDFSKQYEELVRIDALTGFRNEKDYYENLVAEVERAKCYEQSLSLLLIHIESFDDLNHLYGLSQGEKFLKHLSEFIVEITRQSDQHYRIKQNLFAIILPNTDFDGTQLLKKRFIKEFESLNIVVKSSHQRVSIEIDIVFETYKTELDAGAFHNQVIDNLIIGARDTENEENT